MIRLYVHGIPEDKTLEIWEYKTDKLNNHIWQIALKLVKGYTEARDKETEVFIRINGSLAVTLRIIYNPEIERRVLVIVRKTDNKTIVL